MVRELTAFFQSLTGCDAVGVRLRDGQDYPYFETRGLDADFVEAERCLCQRDDQGNVVRDEAGLPVLECMCGQVIRGRTDASLPFFTDRGTFWTNSTTALLSSTSEEDRQARTRDRCNGEGYESVALIPLRTHEETFGLIQFNDRTPGRFSLDRIALLERLATHVAIALHQRQTQSTLQRELSRTEALLQEIHHRVKNNLQIIASLLNLQARELTGDQAVPLQEAQSRVVAMAAVHQQLYEARDYVDVDMGSYLRRLAGLLHQFLGRNDVTVRVQGDCTLDIDSAMRCGLIANELIANAAKHAFPHRPGTVSVEIEPIHEDRYRLAVRDDGVGFDGHEPGQGGLGLRIVGMLAEQMDGEVRFASNEGSLAEVRFRSRPSGRDRG